MKALILAAALLSGATLVHSADTTHMHGDAKTVSRSDKGQATHKAVGVVKKIDASNSKVTLAHEPVKSLDWPAMTMAFVVKDKDLLGKLSAGKKVEFDFQQQGKEYVITSVK